jgi:hypothetical protein
MGDKQKIRIASPWMRPLQAADYLGIAIGTLRNWTWTRFVPFARRRHVVRYHREHLDEWMLGGVVAESEEAEAEAEREVKVVRKTIAEPKTETAKGEEEPKAAVAVETDLANNPVVEEPAPAKESETYGLTDVIDRVDSIVEESADDGSLPRERKDDQ